MMNHDIRRVDNADQRQAVGDLRGATVMEAQGIDENRGQIQFVQIKGSDFTMGGPQQTSLLFLNLHGVGPVVEIESVGPWEVAPQQQLADIMQQAGQKGFLRMRVAHAHGNLLSECAAALGMLPELVKPEVVAALIGSGRLQHGRTQGHVPDRLHIDPVQDGVHIFGVNGPAVLSGLKPEEADAEGRVHPNDMDQLPPNRFFSGYFN